MKEFIDASIFLRMYSENEKNLSGLIPPLVTPINSKDNVCEQSVKKLINFVLPYSSALMPCLSSGEGWALNDKQWEDMIKFTKKYSSCLPVIAGIESKTTSEVVKKAKKAKKLEVDAIVITTPFEKNISQKKIYTHFKQIEKIGMPIFIYNEEAISGNVIELNTIKKICKLGNIIGIKEASGSVAFTKALIDLKLNIPIFQGWEHLCYATIGVEGYILPLLNLEPELCLEMLKNPTQSNQDKIDSICKKYNLLNNDWYVSLKKELHKRGIISTARVI
jgi:4-hydroxy-tetrahydrodipicolinate synthase